MGLNMARRKHSQVLKAEPREYLYVDQTRLNSYIEQISSTERLDKMSSLKVSLGITKLEVTAEQSQRPHPKTNHEKITELIADLRENQHLATKRPGLISNYGEELNIPDFVLEKCKATRILIPAPPGQCSPGIMIWVSEWPEDRIVSALRPPGLLCLIEDVTLDDKRYRAGFSHSGYSWLQALLLQLNTDPRKTTLQNEYPLSLWGDYKWDIMHPQHYLTEEMPMIRKTPTEWLKNKGCSLSEIRNIECLYRIRNLGIDQIGTENRNNEYTVSPFAYAIAIWATSRTKG